MTTTAQNGADATVSTSSDLTRPIPEGLDLIDDLAVRELDIASRKLGADVAGAVGDEAGPLRWYALALLGWLWDKRRDPHAKLDSWLDLNATKLTELLGLNDDDDDDVPAAELTEREELAANPTAGARES